MLCSHSWTCRAGLAPKPSASRGLQLLDEAIRTAAELDDPDLLARGEAIAGLVRHDEARLKRAVDLAQSQGVQADVADWYYNYLGTGRSIRRRARGRPAGH